MKHIKLTFLLTILMSMVGVASLAHDIEAKNADDVTIYYKWINNNTELTVSCRGYSYSSYSNEYTGKVVIPATVTYNGKTYSVTSIDYYAFRGCSGLTSIEISNGVASIENHAFADCSSLTSIVVNDGNPVYDSRDNCNAIIETSTNTLIYGCKYTKIPNSVTDIGYGAFEGCSSLASIDIPNSVTSIGYFAFYGCSGLTSIEIPNSVTSIGYSAFKGCSGLTSIEIPNSVTSIDSYAFEGCSSLASIDIPNSVTNIGDAAFKGTAWYGNQPDGLVYAGKVAYKYKGDMPENSLIVLKDGTTRIDDKAFWGCSGLTSIEIPNSVTSIGFSAFEGCSGLTSIEIPNSVTSIDSYTFEGCSSLASIDIPNSVTSIGYYAFEGCSGLTSIEIPNSVTSIGFSAFEGCSSLASIDISNSVTSIDYCAFKGCSGLTSIEIPNGVASIKNNAFADCSGLTSVTINSSGIMSKTYTSSSNLNTIFGDQVKQYVIGDEVTSIGNFAFYGCSGLTSIEIPNSVTSIENNAFADCSGLTSVTINSSDIMSKTYTSSSNLNTIFGSQVKQYVIGDEVTSIGKFAFYGCSGLTSIELPNSVTSIGGFAFYGCSGLNSIELPNSVTSIGGSAFYGCSGLTSIRLPNSVTSIGDGAFMYCSGLTSIEIPNSVTSIGYYAFYGCSGLTSIEIPNSVTSIGSRSFYDTKLKSVTIGTGIQSIASNAFSYSSSSSGAKPIKVFWLTNTPPTGYEAAGGTVNYVSNSKYTSLNNTVVYPYLNSMFEVDGIKYVPVSPSERTCDAIDCKYDGTVKDVNIGNSVLYRNVSMKVKNIASYAFYGNDNIVSLKIEPDGTIGDYAFYGCTGLASMEVGDNVTSIGRYAFQNCSNMSTASLGKNITSIAACTFDGCAKLQSIDLPDAVTSLGSCAFQNCTSLPSASIPKGIAEIGDYAFSGCSKLKDVVVEDREDGAAVKMGSYVFSSCPLTSVYLGRNLSYTATSSAGYSPFYNMATLESVTMSDKVTEILNYEFASCSALTDLQMGSCVKTIGSYAFQNCTSLSSVSISKGVTEIGDYAFSGCSKLKDVVLEDREDGAAVKMGMSVYSSCPLTSVYLGRNLSYTATSGTGYSPFYNKTTLESVTMSDKVTEIPNYEFAGCSGITSMTLPNTITNIGDYAFQRCSGLASLSVPNSVGTIGRNAFEGCTAMDTFIVGSNVTSIGQNAFSGCTTLTKLISLTANPPTCGTNALNDINKWDCTLTIPENTLAKYQAADQWKDFFFIEEKDLSGINTITMDDGTEMEIKETFDIDGKKTTGLQRGLNIVKLKNGTIRKVVIK